MASEAYEETVAFKRKQTNTASLRSNPLLGMFLKQILFLDFIKFSKQIKFHCQQNANRLPTSS